MDEVERRDAAIRRLHQKREFFTHVIAYIVVNAFLVGVWAITDAGGYFWPVWPMAGWGIGLVLHAFDTFRSPVSEAAIRREMERIGS